MTAEVRNIDDEVELLEVLQRQTPQGHRMWPSADVRRVLALIGLRAIGRGRPVGRNVKLLAASFWSSLNVKDGAPVADVIKAINAHFEAHPMDPGLIRELARLSRSKRLRECTPEARAPRSTGAMIWVAVGASETVSSPSF